MYNSYKFLAVAQTQALLALEKCIPDMRSWLLTNQLMFKDSTVKRNS